MVDFDKIKLGIISLTIGHWDLMQEHWDAIRATYPHPKELYLVPNLGREVSLSAAINKGFKRAMREDCDYIAYIADDVNVAPGDIQAALTKLIEEDLWVVYTHSADSSGYFFFVANPIVFQKVGFWDEEFYPAYFEDNDWDYRIRLKDASKLADCAVNCEHIGSVTVKRMTNLELQQHHRDFEEMRDRYRRKWGGPPGEETFTTSFNNQDAYYNQPF